MFGKVIITVYMYKRLFNIFDIDLIKAKNVRSHGKHSKNDKQKADRLV